MIKVINLEFFKGGSTTTTVQKRDPKSAELVSADANVGNIMSAIFNRYGGTGSPYSSLLNSYNNTGGNMLTDDQANMLKLRNGLGGINRYNGNSSQFSGLWNDSSGNRYYNGKPIRTDEYGMSYVMDGGQKQYVNLGGGYGGGNVGSGSTIEQGSYLDKAFSEADYLAALANKNSADLLLENPTYLRKADQTVDEAKRLVSTASGQANKYYGDADEYLAMHKNLLNTGYNAGLEEYLKPLVGQVTDVYNNTLGTGMSSLSDKGVINSSVANEAVRSAQKEAANALVTGRLSGADLWLKQMLGGADTSGNLAKSVVDTANTSVADMLNVASGYRSNYDSGLNGLKTYAELPQQYYNNALAPLAPYYNYWKDMTNAYYGHEDYDTVVSKNGK